MPDLTPTTDTCGCCWVSRIACDGLRLYAGRSCCPGCQHPEPTQPQQPEGETNA